MLGYFFIILIIICYKSFNNTFLQIKRSDIFIADSGNNYDSDYEYIMDLQHKRNEQFEQFEQNEQNEQNTYTEENAYNELTQHNKNCRFCYLIGFNDM